MIKNKHGWDTYRPYRNGDLSRVWSGLRAEDARELSTLSASGPDQIEAGLLSVNARLVTWDTEAGPVSVLGVTPMGVEGAGLVWAVASDAARPRWRFAVKTTASILDDLGQGYSVLANFKDSRNTQQINWLKRVGFTFIAQHDGLDGLRYLEFVRIIR